MKKWLSAFALMISASFLGGCAMDAGGGDDPRSEEAQVTEEGTGSAASALTSCPSPATCQNADRLCQDPEDPSQQWACDVLYYYVANCDYGF